MRQAVAIAIDGVLRHEVGHRPIEQGLSLYRVLAPAYNVVLIGDRDTAEYTEQVAHFLRIESMTEHGRVAYGPASSLDPAGRRVRLLSRLRNGGLALDFVIEADPHISARLFELGFNVLHFMHAQYTRPQWRPDFERKVKAWDDLVAQETSLKAARAADKRTDQW